MIDQDLRDAIREVLDRYAGLAGAAGSLDDDADLFAAGMTSFASVSVMLGLEERLDITFPESMLKRSTFESVSGIAAAVAEARSAVLD